MAILSLMNASSFINLMGAVSTLKDLSNDIRFPSVSVDETDKGVSGVGTPPASAPGATPPIVEPKRDPNSGLPDSVVSVFDKVYKAMGMGGVRTKEQQVEVEEKAEANQARVKLNRNWFEEQIQGFGVRALFIFGGAFLTGLGVIFMLREARPDVSADIGENLIRKLDESADAKS